MLRSRGPSLPPTAAVSAAGNPDLEPASVVDHFFDAHPETRQRVLDVMAEYEAETFRRCGDATEILRAAAHHFIDRPDDRFHENAPFLLIDMAAPVKQMGLFHTHLRRVRPYYAMKCNPSDWMLQTMVALGAHMDCASLGEIERAMRFGVSVKNIVFANPHKPIEAMCAAERHGVQHTTFDSAHDIPKLKRYMPSCKAILRLSTNDGAAQCSFSDKFGARMFQVPHILECARAHSVRVVGVAFHVGSGNSDVGAYIDALRNARVVFDLALKYGFTMDLLDIGGGLPGHDDEKLGFEAIAATLRPQLDELFPDVEIIAEPGRFFAARAQTIVASVYADRVVEAHADSPQGEAYDEYSYFIEDGAYHSFNCLIFDHAHPKFFRVRPPPPADDGGDDETVMGNIWGPTCDSMDVVVRGRRIPKLRDGEWIFFPDMGAYTTAAATSFNGFGTHRREFISTLHI